MKQLNWIPGYKIVCKKLFKFVNYLSGYMKLLSLTLIIFFHSSFTARSQNWPACDSLEINCCTFDSLGPNTLTIYASNNSSELFGYPNFALLNTNMDTIAMETVNYFGISTGPQPHTLNILAPMTLPFTGYLYLFAWFQDTLPCVFPFTIPDTTTGISVIQQNVSLIEISPNPVLHENNISLNTGILPEGNASLTLFNMQGVQVINKEIIITPEKLSEIEIKNILPGIYVVRLQLHGQYYSTRFVKL